MGIPIFSVIVPLVAAAMLSLVVKGKPARYIALLGSLISLALVVLALTSTTATQITWLSFIGVNLVLSASTLPIN
ncbi:MAG: hypothetical protein ACREBW_01435, partial [Candidatus Micrarchaeaceae archaeon]